MTTHSKPSGKAGRDAPLSGPHICSAVGGRTISAVRAALLEACEHHNGELNAAEIDHVLELLSTLPDLFRIYAQGYADCAKIHQTRSFEAFENRRFARFAITAYCGDTATRVFAHQIAEGGREWIWCFVDGVIEYLETWSAAGAVNRIFECYTRVGSAAGMDLTLQHLLQNRDLQATVAGIMEPVRKLKEASAKERTQFENTLNTAISKRLNAGGPSPVRINDTDLGRFLVLLETPGENAFRKAVNACPAKAA